jgi:hypothetical protein
LGTVADWAATIENVDAALPLLGLLTIKLTGPGCAESITLICASICVALSRLYESTWTEGDTDVTVAHAEKLFPVMVTATCAPGVAWLGSICVICGVAVGGISGVASCAAFRRSAAVAENIRSKATRRLAGFTRVEEKQAEFMATTPTNEIWNSDRPNLKLLNLSKSRRAAAPK